MSFLCCRYDSSVICLLCYRPILSLTASVFARNTHPLFMISFAEHRREIHKRRTLCPCWQFEAEHMHLHTNPSLLQPEAQSASCFSLFPFMGNSAEWIFHLFAHSTRLSLPLWSRTSLWRRGKHQQFNSSCRKEVPRSLCQNFHLSSTTQEINSSIVPLYHSRIWNRKNAQYGHGTSEQPSCCQNSQSVVKKHVRASSWVCEEKVIHTSQARRRHQDADAPPFKVPR